MGTPVAPLPAIGATQTTLQQIIAAYLYKEYSDDDDLQALFASYNGLAQQYLDWFNQIGLPVYTGPMIAGAVLDWVAAGLYGMIRPALPSGHSNVAGPYNTIAFNVLPFNALKQFRPTAYYATSDDTFKRIITWHFYKGDGKVFNIRWLKRRIMRFLNGPNGTSYNIDNTYQVSVTFSGANQVNINILRGIRIVTGGSIYGRSPFNTFAYNQIESTFTPFAPLALAPIFKAAVDAGVLELPFQFAYVVAV